jgi:hypothetical protein
MKKTLFVCLILLISTGRVFSQELSNVAYKDNSVRFTVISDGTLRMEFSPNGKFTDNRSFRSRGPAIPVSEVQGETE